MPPPPLHGITVIDFTRVMSGPYCTMLLGDMGARVIKIERPGRGDDTRAWGPPFVKGESTYFLSINRNKESLSLDLKAPAARDIVMTLLAKADILVENFTPGTIERLGFGYEAMSAAFPRLVYCSISGFGQSGPRRSEPGYDAVMQAEAGLMSITGPENGAAYRLGIPIADIVTGMSAAQGIAMACSPATARVGDSALTSACSTRQRRCLPTRRGSSSPRATRRSHGQSAPVNRSLRDLCASDGEFVLAIGNDEQWRRFCRAIAIEHLASDERFSTNDVRIAHYSECGLLLTAALGRARERTGPRS